MSNNIPDGCSPLASYYELARWYPEGLRPKAIDTITIHCYVAQVTAMEGCKHFANRPEDKKGSCNYVVGCDGSIGVSVPETSASWCSNSSENDDRAVTIEVASDNFYPYKVTQEAYSAMLDLVTDICKRNDIKQLVWSTDKNKRTKHLDGCNMTVHRDYYAKECPGDYLYERLGSVAAEVNRRLKGRPRIANFRLTKLLPTKIEAAFGMDLNSIALDNLDNYTFSYKVYEYIKNDKGKLEEQLYKTYPLSVTSFSCEFSTENIFVPNTQYSIELFIKDLTDDSTDSAAITPKVRFITAQEYPDEVTNLVLNLEDRLLKNKNIFIKFSVPKKWGYWGSYQKGFRINLIVDGEVKKYYDDLLNYQDNIKEVSITIPLTTLLKDFSQADLLNKNFQIGVQPWVLDNKNKLVLDSTKMKCSNSIYTKYLLDTVDKVFLNVNNKHKRALVYLPTNY
jgi:hypothetical protein